MVGLGFGRRKFGGLGGAGALLPFDDGLPVLGLFFIELFFPFLLCFFTVPADMPAFVASSAVAALDVVVQLALGLGSYFIAVDYGVKVRAFEAIRELGGLLVLRSTDQVRFVRFGVGFVGVWGGVSSLWIFVGLSLGLIPFFLH